MREELQLLRSEGRNAHTPTETHSTFARRFQANGSLRVDHFWQDVDGWFDGADLYVEQIRKARDGAVFVELGSWKGRSTAFVGVEIANSGKNIQFYSVDNWRGSEDEPDHMTDPDVVSGRLFEVFSANIAPIRSYVQPVISDSAAAAARFGDDSVDVVYVDAAHTYQGVMRDLIAWWPKLRSGGTMAGDDWCWYPDEPSNPTVRRAVEEFFGAQGLDIRIHNGSSSKDWLQWAVQKP